ncbi:MAG: hypothetical protein P8X80_22110 [Desulfobacterales bacterium]
MIDRLSIFSRSALCMAVLSMMSTAASAQGSSEKGREIILAPYLWGTSIDGTSAVGDLPPLDIDAGFSDLLSNLNFAMSPEPAPPGAALDVEVDVWMVELWGGYRLNENWEAIGGLRYQDQEITIGGLPSPPLPVSSAGVSADWTDWFVGARFKSDIGDKWSMTWRGDVVIAGDSDTSWNTSIFFNRRMGKKGNKALNLGYRYFVDDFVESGVYGWDVTQNGPAIGFTWVF